MKAPGGPRWFEDPEVPPGSGPGRPQAGSQTLDPASTWTLGHGAPFDVTKAQPEPEAFDQLIGIRPYRRARPDPKTPVEADTSWQRHVRLSPTAAADRWGTLGRAFAQEEFTIYPAPLPPHALPSVAANAEVAVRWRPPEGLATDRLVIVAVIDDAINIAHRRFVHTTGPRIDYAWIQDASRGRDGADGGAVPFGREWSREAIDRALSKHNDEDDALRALGLLDFTGTSGAPSLARSRAHGTHVLDIAAGADPADPQAAQVRILAVQLPKLVTRDTSGQQYAPFVLSGVAYVLHRARIISEAVNRPVPVVLNFSYGISAGSHDGRHVVEEAIERLVEEHNEDHRGRAFTVIPSGNRTLARGHASCAGSGGKGTTTLTLPWRLPPGDATPSYMEVWLPQGAFEALEVKLPDGTGQVIDSLKAPVVLSLVAPGTKGWEDTVIGRIASDVAPAWDEGEAAVGKVPLRDDLREAEEARRLRRILFALAPTAPDATHRAPAPHGLWRITVRAALKDAGERIDAWLQRDDTPLAHSPTFGQQSYFDDDAYDRFDARGFAVDADPDPNPSSVSRSGSLNAIATGKASIVVGGYVQSTKTMARYSGTSREGMRAPDVAAISDRSFVRPGVLCAGVRSGSTVALNGTSVAAPQVARYLAEALLASSEEVDPKAFRDEFLAALRDQAVASPDVHRARLGGVRLHPELERPRLGDGDPTDEEPAPAGTVLVFDAPSADAATAADDPEATQRAVG